MSYCRWSTPKCDLYCYEDVGGFFSTNIAGYRDRIWVTLFRWLTDKRVRILNYGTFRTIRFNLFWMPHWTTHKRIRLKYAGDSFKDDTVEEMFDRMLALRKMGYRVPDSALERAKEEMK